MRILIVDDDRLNLKVIEGYFNAEFPQFEVMFCQKPAEVLNLLETNSIDIILLDIMMPGITGVELLQMIRENAEYKEIQILMMTAMDDEKLFSKCFELGANDYLRKPVNAVELKARIKSAADTRVSILMLKDLYSKVKHQNDKIKLINEKLKDTQFNLIQSEKLNSIGVLAAGVAHEINNPIGFVESNLEVIDNYIKKICAFFDAIVNDVNMLKENGESCEIEKVKQVFLEEYKKYKIDFVSEDLKSIVKDSKEGITRVVDIVKALMRFSKTAGEEEKNHWRISEIIQQVLMMVKNEGDFEVVLDIKDDYELYCDRMQLEQVLLHIAMNAIEAISGKDSVEKGKVTIRIYSEDGYECVDITDNGPGIDEVTLLRIFDPFFTTKDVGKGTGLGLSISHDIIVKNHNGNIDVKSELGIGTTFTIKIPQKNSD